MRRYDLADDDVHDSVIAELAGGVWRLALRNRRAVLGGLAALGVVTYASVNALFLQDGAHPSAFFETRDVSRDRFALRADEADGPAAQPSTQVTRIVFDGQAGDTDAPVAPRPERRPVAETLPEADPVAETIIAAPAPVEEKTDDPVTSIQTMLASLGFYDSEIDGIVGPRTTAAIEAYKTSVGLRGIELSTDELLTSLNNNMMVTAAIPRPRPETTEPVPIPQVTPAPQSERRIGAAAEAPVADPTVLRVQAGLKAFGNEDIRVDGVAGERTRLAVREFQSLFRLPVNGEIDDALVEKMVAVGLID